MTSVTQETLEKIKQRAIALKIPFKDIRPSNRKGKKIEIELINPTGIAKVHFGAKGSETFIEGASQQKRKQYQARHSKIISNGKPAYLQPYSASWMSWNLLW